MWVFAGRDTVLHSTPSWPVYESDMKGVPTSEQIKAIKPFIEGKVVHDLGCAHLDLAHALIKWGAKEVIAIDRNRTGAVVLFPYQMRLVQAHFHEFHEPVDVAFMSCPVNWPTGLDHIAARARIVIYLGNNTDGTATGDPSLFKVLRARENPVYIPHIKNTLAIYGPELVRDTQLFDRPANPEEVAVLDTPDYVWSYWEAHNPFKIGFQVVLADEIHGFDPRYTEDADAKMPRIGVIKGFDRGIASVLWKGDDEPTKVAIRALRGPSGRYQVLVEEGDGASSSSERVL